MTDYSRQTALDQERLLQSKITIVGSSAIAHFFCLYASGLGIGNIRIIESSLVSENNNEFMFGRDLFRFLKKESKSEKLKKKLSPINSDVKIDCISLNYDKSLIGNPNVILDLSNSTETKKSCLEYSIDNNIPLISCSSSNRSAAVSCFSPQSRGSRLFLDTVLLEDYRNHKQGSFSSAIIAAIALDETRKIVAPVEGDKKLAGRLDYSMNLEQRLSQTRQKPRKWAMEIPGKAAIIGAGGIGTYAALCLSIIGGTVHIFDGDNIEPSNLNRQVLYSKHVGKNKATSLKKELEGFCSNKIVAIPQFFKESDNVGCYDVVLCCVDSWEAREPINRKCVESRIPLVNGSVTAFSSKVNGYIPSKPCLACKYDFETLKGMQTSRGSCGSYIESNIVMANALTGAMMAAEACAIVSGMDTLATKDFEYFSNPGLRGRSRVSARDTREGCICGRKKWPV